MTSVLVLDDRRADRELLATVLRYAGYSVEEASTGQAALDLARTKRPDLITTDILMPEMNGYEFLRQLREDPATSETPVIFCTVTYDEEEVRRLAEANGVSHVLVKPSEPEEIIRVVGTALGSAKEIAERRFDREQLRVLNEKLVGKVNELEVANREHAELQEHLYDAERGAAETLTLLETLQSTAPVGLGFVDRDFRIVRMNETLAAVNGLPLNEQLGRLMPEVAPELWPQLEPTYRRVLDTGEAVVNQEVETPTSEGGEAHFWLASYYPVRVEAEVVGIGLVVLDITELKQAEDFRSVVMENMAEGLYAVDHDGRLAFINSAASKMLGWEEEELRGKPAHDTIHFQRADGSPHPIEECELVQARVEGRTVRTSDDAYTRKDGSIFPASCSAAPLLRGTSISGAVVVFRDTTEETEERARRQRELDALTWVGRVREALDEDRFVLYSQPIVPLAGGEASEELLLRMVDREGETIAPGSFLPVAEKYGLVGEIDKWVVPEAIRLAASGRRVEANLSAESISNMDLLSLIERELGRTRADPAYVGFEITETALMEDLEAGEAFARGLAEIGCGLALDDFGTGFGSFTYLKNMPITYLKIDIEFVRDIASNPANQHLVKATVGLARDFGYETIAEGVEDAKTLALLKDYGVDYAQGFHFGRPAPLENP
ncbi:MAG: EAL domain-containing protein [Actinomycetota bacterium]|nr:EAL domain-containing protein [Actinomycetota bacterium]